MTPSNLVWVDVETTGLDALEDLLLEIAVIVTDSDLNELWVGDWPIYADITLNELEPEILDMHMGNGLLRDVVREGKLLEDVDDILLSMMASSSLWPLECAKPPLCGSSVQFDRQWLQACFPEFEAELHYRNIDVSTIKELARRWAPQLNVFSTSDKPHRALGDLRASIAELKFYRSYFIEFPTEPFATL